MTVERQMTGPATARALADRDRRVTLALLWAWTLFNYVYGDVFHIFMIFKSPEMQLQMESGSLGGVPLDRTTMLAMAAGMELAIAMVFLSWALPRRASRLLNIAIGALFTAVMAAVLFGAGRLPPLTGYTLYGAIEIATTAAIVWLAWTWHPADVPA